jgi:3-hydroxyisobutyrate dehydrogenase-like beta-hydroxyacid dehydrogenase
MNIAFLGLGKMGTPIARNLLAAGHTLTLWNRTPAKSLALAAEFPTTAIVAPTPAAAAVNQSAVLTMLMDDEAHESVLFAPDGLLSTLAPGAVHIALSTISVPLSQRIAQAHAGRGQLFVAAPVFGRPNVAADARLWIAAAGSPAAIALARPILETLSRGITVVGPEPHQAHALKLGGNLMITAMVQTLSEAFVFAQSQGIDPAIFLETVNSALFQSPFYAAYGNVLLNPPATPGATVDLGAKDTRLAREAASAAGITLGLADYLAQILSTAQQNGLGQGDWAVGQYRTAQMLATRKPAKTE